MQGLVEKGLLPTYMKKAYMRVEHSGDTSDSECLDYLHFLCDWGTVHD